MIAFKFGQEGKDWPRERGIVAQLAGASILLRLASIAITFASGVAFARILGVGDYGAYVYAMSWVTVLTDPSVGSSDRLLVREVALYDANVTIHAPASDGAG